MGTMDQKQSAVYVRAYNLGLDIANGRHPLSKTIAPLLWIFDLVLCALVIWKVPCKLFPMAMEAP